MSVNYSFLISPPKVEADLLRRVLPGEELGLRRRQAGAAVGNGHVVHSVQATV